MTMQGSAALLSAPLMQGHGLRQQPRALPDLMVATAADPPQVTAEGGLSALTP